MHIFNFTLARRRFKLLKRMDIISQDHCSVNKEKSTRKSDASKKILQEKGLEPS